MTNYQLVNYNVMVRKVLQAATDLSAHFQTSSEGQDYRVQAAFSDLNIYLENENLNFITDDGGKALSKPSLVIYSSYGGVEPPTNGLLTVEFQFMVNNNELPLLDAYTSLCRLLCNLREEEYRWSSKGLLPKRDKRTGQIEYKEFLVQDGSQVYPDLRHKILLRSVQCNFYITGALYVA